MAKTTAKIVTTKNIKIFGCLISSFGGWLFNDVFDVVVEIRNLKDAQKLTSTKYKNERNHDWEEASDYQIEDYNPISVNEFIKKYCS